MPFVGLSKRMAKARAGRRNTRQQFEIESLSRQFQRGASAAANQFTKEQNAIQAGYQTQLADYADRLKQFESQTEGFRDEFNAYNQSVDRFNTVQDLPGTFVQLPRRDRPSTYLTAKGPNNNADFLVDAPAGRALANVPGTVKSTWYVDKRQRVDMFDASNLPDTLVLNQVGTSRGGYPQYKLAQRQGPNPGDFDVPVPEFQGAAPDAPSFEGLSEQFSESVRKQREFTEREIGERKAGSLRARRRMTDRTMLQRS